MCTITPGHLVKSKHAAETPLAHVVAADPSQVEWGLPAVQRKKGTFTRKHEQHVISDIFHEELVSALDVSVAASAELLHVYQVARMRILYGAQEDGQHPIDDVHPNHAGE